MTDDSIISQTISWINKVVIGCNFCPFAAKAMLQKSIRFTVLHEPTEEIVLTTLAFELQFLNDNPDTETTLIILPEHFEIFDSYLDLVDLSEELLLSLGYEGVYQLATFHPEYLFAESYEEDPANYTNRSIYPMLHILREASISKAIDNYPDAGGIPQRNVDFANRKGLIFMKMLWETCLKQQ
jgi:hypothetical protein